MRRLSYMFTLAALFAYPVFPAEQQKVCVKYEQEIGWSKSYRVDATIVKGTELIRATNDYFRFNSFSTYAVIFWEKDQATILEMPPLSMGNVPMLDSTVQDMEGRNWQIRRGNSLCF